MKKLQYIFILLMTSTFFIACQNSRGVEKAEDMGKYTFDILKKMDNVSKDDYLKAVFTIEEIKEFGKTHAEKIGVKNTKEIANLTTEEYNGRMERDFNRIKEAEKKYSIVWNNIEYSDYTFETREENNMNGTRGNILFKHNDLNYSMRVSALNIDGTYTLIRLAGLKQL